MQANSSALEINGYFKRTTSKIEDKQTKDVDRILFSTVEPPSSYYFDEFEEIHEVFTEFERKDILQATREPYNNSNVRDLNESLKNTSGNTTTKVKEKVYGQICLNCSRTDGIALRSKEKVFGVENIRKSDTIKNVSSLQVIIKEHTQNNLNYSKNNEEYQTTTTEVDYLDLLSNEYVLTSTLSGNFDENFTTYFTNESFYENSSDSAVRIIQEFPWPVKKEAVVEGDIVLGGLMMVHEREDTITCGPVMPQGGIQALEAMLYTLDRLNESPTPLLPNITLGAHILDDCDKDTYGLEMAVDFIKGRWIYLTLIIYYKY